MSDMTLQWLQANGATSNSISDAWREMLNAKLLIGQRNDMWRDYLISVAPADIGRQMNDLELWFWDTNGGDLGGESLFFHFDKATTYATFPEWTPLGLPFTVAVTCIPTNVDLSEQYILNGDSANRYIKIGGTVARTQARLRDVSDTAISFTGSTPSVVQDVIQKATLIGHVGNSTYDFAGDSKNSALVAGPSFNKWTHIAARSDGFVKFQGPMGKLYLTDTDNPANSRFYPMDEGSGNKFLCYTDDTKATPDPTNDATITGYVDDTPWKVVDPPI